jgi:hypothetical protein
VLLFIENEGALFRGPSRGWPTHVWSPNDRAFVAYEGNVPKTVDWGEIVDDARASEMIGFNVQTLPPCGD